MGAATVRRDHWLSGSGHAGGDIGAVERRSPLARRASKSKHDRAHMSVFDARAAHAGNPDSVLTDRSRGMNGYRRDLG
jgi:hypothetical protein